MTAPSTAVGSTLLPLRNLGLRPVAATAAALGLRRTAVCVGSRLLTSVDVALLAFDAVPDRLHQSKSFQRVSTSKNRVCMLRHN